MGRSKSPRGRGNSLALLVRDGWFKEPNKSSLWLRIHTSVGVSQEKLEGAFAAMTQGVATPAPVYLAAAHLEGFKLVQGEIRMVANEDGGPLLKVEARETELEPNRYIVLSAPFKVDGHEGSEAEVKGLLDRFSALLCAHTGLNLMRIVAFEGEVEAGDGRYHNPGRPIKVPKPAEGPFLHSGNWADTAEIWERVALQPADIRRRIELALEFFNRAMRAEDPFFYYWTALEVLCNGKSGAIKRRLAESYGLSVTDADRRLGFRTIARWRVNLFHKGQRAGLSADVERYVQLLFLDLLRHEVHMPAKHHASGMLQSGIYDLSPLEIEPPRG